MFMFRLSKTSSNINILTQSKHDFKMALKNCGFPAKLIHKPMDEAVEKILWFTPRYNMAEAYKLQKKFFRLFKKTFHRWATYTKYLIRTKLDWFMIYSFIWKSNLTDKMKRSFFQAAVVSILLYGCTTWTLTKRLEKKLDGNYTRMLRATPHTASTVRPPTTYHENYTS